MDISNNNKMKKKQRLFWQMSRADCVSESAGRVRLEAHSILRFHIFTYRIILYSTSVYPQSRNNKIHT